MTGKDISKDLFTTGSQNPSTERALSSSAAVPPRVPTLLPDLEKEGEMESTVVYW